jgi:hypothetical protein
VKPSGVAVESPTSPSTDEFAPPRRAARTAASMVGLTKVDISVCYNGKSANAYLPLILPSFSTMIFRSRTRASLPSALFRSTPSWPTVT